MVKDTRSTRYADLLMTPPPARNTASQLHEDCVMSVVSAIITTAIPVKLVSNQTETKGSTSLLCDVSGFFSVDQTVAHNCQF